MNEAYFITGRWRNQIPDVWQRGDTGYASWGRQVDAEWARRNHYSTWPSPIHEFFKSKTSISEFVRQFVHNSWDRATFYTQYGWILINAIIIDIYLFNLASILTNEDSSSTLLQICSWVKLRSDWESQVWQALIQGDEPRDRDHHVGGTYLGIKVE